jgi:hypothetical protein
MPVLSRPLSPSYCGVAAGGAGEQSKEKRKWTNNKGMAYLLVGRHHNWGKSQTLKALTGGSTHKHWIDIISKKDGKTYPFFIRRMSNTDKPESFMDFIKAVTH